MPFTARCTIKAKGSWSQRQVRCADERAEFVLLIAGPAAVALDAAAEFQEFVEPVIGQFVTAPVLPEPLDRVQLRRVGRQQFGVQAGAAVDPVAQEPRAVAVDPVPDHHGVAAQVPQQVAQERGDLAVVDRGVEMGVEEQPAPTPPGGDADGADDRHLLAVPGAVPEDRRLAAQPPGLGDERHHQVAGFVDEHEVCLQPRDFFLTRGQSRLSQRSIAASSRSTGRVAGFCQLSPQERTNRLRWSTSYRTPWRRSISRAMRGSVHRSVSNPQPLAPRTTTHSTTSATCASSNPGGRPGGRLTRSAAAPPPSRYSRTHPHSVAGCTPIARATSACGRLRSITCLTASRRRSYNCCGVPLGRTRGSYQNRRQGATTNSCYLYRAQ